MDFTGDSEEKEKYRQERQSGRTELDSMVKCESNEIILKYL